MLNNQELSMDFLTLNESSVKLDLSKVKQNTNIGHIANYINAANEVVCVEIYMKDSNDPLADFKTAFINNLLEIIVDKCTAVNVIKIFEEDQVLWQRDSYIRIPKSTRNIDFQITKNIPIKRNNVKNINSKRDIINNKHVEYMKNNEHMKTGIYQT